MRLTIGQSVWRFDWRLWCWGVVVGGVLTTMATASFDHTAAAITASAFGGFIVAWRS